MTTGNTAKKAMSDVRCYLSIAELSGLVRRQEVSPVEVATECLKRIETLNTMLNALSQ